MRTIIVKAVAAAVITIGGIAGPVSAVSAWEPTEEPNPAITRLRAMAASDAGLPTYQRSKRTCGRVCWLIRRYATSSYNPPQPDRVRVRR